MSSIASGRYGPSLGQLSHGLCPACLWHVQQLVQQGQHCGWHEHHPSSITLAWPSHQHCPCVTLVLTSALPLCHPGPRISTAPVSPWPSHQDCPAAPGSSTPWTSPVKTNNYGTYHVFFNTKDSMHAVGASRLPQGPATLHAHCLKLCTHACVCTGVNYHCQCHCHCHTWLLMSYWHTSARMNDHVITPAACKDS